MAGESPGGAEQQESSGETTGKAADPSEAVRGEAEPALAVAVADGPEPPRAADDSDAQDDERRPGAGSRDAEVSPGRVASGGEREAAAGADASAEDAAEDAAEDGTGAGAPAADAAEDAAGADASTEGALTADALTADALTEDALTEDAATADAAAGASAEGGHATGDAESGAGAPEGVGEADGTPEAASGAADAAPDDDPDAADGVHGASGTADGASGTAQGAPEGTPAAPEASDAPGEPSNAAGAPADAPGAAEDAQGASDGASDDAPGASDDAPPKATGPAKAAAPAKAPAPAGTAVMPVAAPPVPPALPGFPAAPAAPPAFGTGRPSPRESTRQQPLPPAPEEPLKLLAALTNTPAPPPTMLRTAVRRVKIWTPLVLLLAIVYCVVQALRPLPAPSLALTARPAYAFAGSAPAMPWPSEGQAAVEVEGLGSMGTFGKQKPEPIASVAKIMTAYIVLHDHPMKQGSTGARLTVDQQAAADFKLGAEGESVVKVTAGERISQFEALEDIMIASANNIARMLARWDAGSEAAFVKKMNATAKSLGMSHTTYTDPSGLTATTISTASDQLKLVGKAMDDPVFRQVVAEPSYRTASGEAYANWNHLVGTNDVVGVKTGTSTAAGGNLVFAAYKDVGGTTQLIMGVVLGQYRPSILDTVTAASLKLVLAAQHSLTSARVIEKGTVVGYADNGFGDRTPVVATRTVTAVGWPGVRVPIALTTGTLPHAAKAGTTVGTLTVGAGPARITVPVALQGDVTAPGLGDKLTRLG